MTTAVFDTLKASDDLKAVGIEAKQAEAIVHTMAGAFEDTVATKSDLVEVKSELKQDITDLKADIVAVRADMDKLEVSVKSDLAIVKADLKRDIADLKAELSASLYRMLLAQLAVAGVLFAALKLF